MVKGTLVIGLLIGVAWGVGSGDAAFAQEKKLDTVWLDDLDIARIQQGWGEPQKNRSVDGNPIAIGGRTFTRGVGTHAASTFLVNLKGDARRFQAWVGVNDEVKTRGTVTFQLFAGGRRLWESGPLRGGDAPKQVDVDVSGVETLALVVLGGDDGIDYDHADWAEARFLVAGRTPEAVTIVKKPYLLTPKPPAAPRINGAKVFGVRPGRPFLFTVAATGERPLTFRADGLPAGLRLDEMTGRITGRVEKRGSFEVTLWAKNARGEAGRPFKIVVGDRICLTPPLGWNSWNCWAHAVDDAKIRATARAMVDKGLVHHGWTYVNIDDCWQGLRGGKLRAIQPNEKFPDMKALADYVHGLGLKLGIYSTPWITSYAGFCGGSSDAKDGAWVKAVHGQGGKDYWKNRRHGRHKFDANDAQQWAAWGIDYLKYDWGPNEVESMERMATALENSGRDIVYSLSNTAPFALAGPFSRRANLWRTTGDIRDHWDYGRSDGRGYQGVVDIWRYHERWAKFNGPGHWNDPDMLVVGKVGWGKLRPSKLSPDEQYVHISLWCLWSAPMLLGCPVEELDPFTVNLLTNDEVLEVNQDPLGRQAGTVAREGDRVVLAKKMEDGSLAVGLFNRGFLDAEVSVTWSDLGITGMHRVRDLWRQQDLGLHAGRFTASVPSHGVVLVRMFEAE